MSRKSRKTKRRASQRVPPLPRKAAQAPSFSRLQDPEANVAWFYNPPGVEKMSEVLLKFAEPILDTLDSSAPLDEIRAALEFAMTIWNYSLLPAQTRSKGLPEVIMSDPWLKSAAEVLLERKAQLFAANRRVLYGLEVFEEGDEFRVNVLSLIA
jgi:hypothetical protein